MFVRDNHVNEETRVHYKPHETQTVLIPWNTVMGVKLKVDCNRRDQSGF